MKYRLAVTHFNNETWLENTLWRERKEYDGCIYNSPIRIKDSLPVESKIYVIEMNNETNKIEGIGLIKNKLFGKMNKIYSDNNYNRYSYYGKKRLTRDVIDEETLKNLEDRLFRGKRGYHLKRSQGISEVPLDVYKDYLEYVDSLFKLAFGDF